MKYIIYLALFAIAFGNLNSLEPELYNPEGVEFETSLFDRDGFVYAYGTDDIYGKEIWKMDKTKDLMVRVTDLDDDAEPRYFDILNGKLLFVTSAKNGTVIKMWSLDSSSTIPEFLREIDYEHSYTSLFFYSVFSKFEINNKYYINLVMEDREDIGIIHSEIWITDGTAENTNRILKKSSRNSIRVYKVGSNVVTFEYQRSWQRTILKILNSNNEFEMLKEIEGNYTILNETYKEFRNGKLYFKINKLNNIAEELWVTDGTKNGTSKLIAIEDSLNVAGYVYDNLEKTKLIKVYDLKEPVKSRLKLVLTDGSTENTVMLNDDMMGDSLEDVTFIDEINNKFIFTTLSNEGFNIWSTDGTTEGTMKILTKKNFYEFKYPYFTPKNENQMYFLIFDSNDVATLIETDGTVNNTSEKINFSESSVNFGSGVWIENSLYKDKVVFTVDNSKIYFYDPLLDTMIYKQEVSFVNNHTFETYNDVLYFTSRKSFLYFNEYKNKFVKIEPKNPISHNKIVVGSKQLIDDKLYFRANYYDDGYKLYRIDNTFQTVSNIEAQPTDELNLYPNPTGDFLNISVDEATSVSIIDLTGKVVMSLENYSGGGINTSDLPAGVYNIILDDNTFGGKFVKE